MLIRRQISSSTILMSKWQPKNWSRPFHSMVTSSHWRSNKTTTGSLLDMATSSLKKRRMWISWWVRLMLNRSLSRESRSLSRDLKLNRREKPKAAVSSLEPSPGHLMSRRRRMNNGFASTSTAGNCIFRITSMVESRSATSSLTRSTISLGLWFHSKMWMMHNMFLMNAKKLDPTRHWSLVVREFLVYTNKARCQLEVMVLNCSRCKKWEHFWVNS